MVELFTCINHPLINPYFPTSVGPLKLYTVDFEGIRGLERTDIRNEGSGH